MFKRNTSSNSDVPFALDMGRISLRLRGKDHVSRGKEALGLSLTLRSSPPPSEQLKLTGLQLLQPSTARGRTGGARESVIHLMHPIECWTHYVARP